MLLEKPSRAISLRPIVADKAKKSRYQAWQYEAFDRNGNGIAVGDRVTFGGTVMRIARHPEIGITCVIVRTDDALLFQIESDTTEVVDA